MERLKKLFPFFVVFLLILFCTVEIDAGSEPWKNKLGPRIKKLIEEEGKSHFRIMKTYQTEEVDIIVSGRDREILEEYGEIKHNFWLIPATAMRIPLDRVESIAKKSNIKKINMDHEVHSLRSESIPMIRADIARSDFDLNGTGVNVSIVDSGIYKHTEFQNPNRIIEEQCYCY
ncbi:MAG: hypothetical protein ABEK36_01050, partial [Candidatus Aenigmatarchaeota archaeon]